MIGNMHQCEPVVINILLCAFEFADIIKYAVYYTIMYTVVPCSITTTQNCTIDITL